MRLTPQTFIAGTLAATLLSFVAGCGHQTESRASADQSEVESMTKVLAAGETKGADTAVAATFQHSGGFQTISGRIKFDGAAPERKSIMSKINKDQAICAPGGKDVLGETLIVNAQNDGIANVILFLKTEKDRNVPVHESAQKPANAAPEMDNKNCLFVPHITMVHTGHASIPLRNLDPVDHNMNIQSRANVAKNATIPANSSSTYDVSKEEPMPFPVSCTIHPWMKGWMHVRGNGYFAVTNENGEFKIENLPTGDKLTIQVWHEAAGRGDGGGYIGGLTIGGDVAKPAKGGFTVTLDKDAAPGEIEIMVPAASLPGA